MNGSVSKNIITNKFNMLQNCELLHSFVNISDISNAVIVFDVRAGFDLITG